MVKIRERQNNYGLLVAVLLIIIMVLISYIAYSKGLEKNRDKTTTTTTTTKLIKKKINKLYTYQDICKEEKECNKDIANIDGLIIKLESIKEDNIISHNLVFSGKIEKTISLKNFISIETINDEFFIIEDNLETKNENNNLTLYDKNLLKLDKIVINNLLDRISDGLEITYFTYDDSCTEEENNENYTKNISLISSEGFNIISSTKGPLKEEGFTC